MPDIKTDRETIIKTIDMGLSLNACLILQDINMEVQSGEMVAIIGPNGAGKTSLMRVILGLVKPTRGKVKVLGALPSKLRKKRDEIGYMPQRPMYKKNIPLSVLDVVSMGAVTSTSLGRPFTRQQRGQARKALSQVGLLKESSRPFSELSGGQQQRTFLARALCKKPGLLLLDEPNAGLDLPTQSMFFQLLKKLQQEQGLTVVMVSHDLTVAAGFADKFLCINRTMHVHGSPWDVLNSPHLEEAYRCEFEVLFGRKRD